MRRRLRKGRRKDVQRRGANVSIDDTDGRISEEEHLLDIECLRHTVSHDYHHHAPLTYLLVLEVPLISKSSILIACMFIVEMPDLVELNGPLPTT